MILVLFLYVSDVFATQKQNLRQEPPLEYYDGELPPGDPIHSDYGVSDFWWEDSTTRWLPWWEKMNVTIPEPRSLTETETTIETSKTPEGANKTMPIAGTTGQNETATQTDTTTRRFFSTTPADAQSKTDADFSFPEIFDANLLAQLRAQQSLAAIASSTQKLSSENTPDYDYYGELHNDIPPNVRGLEYPGLSPDIPVILKAGNKTEKKRPPAIPGWRLQFPDQPTKKEELYDGTPKPEKTTFQVNNDYFDVINDGMIIEPLPGERAGRSLQPNSGSEESEKSTVIGYNTLRAMNYPGPQDKPAVKNSIENALGVYSPVPFKFDEVATGHAFMAQFSVDGREGMIKLPPTLKAVHALSPTYTVPQIEENGTPATRSINTWFIYTKEPTATTWFTMGPTTTTRLTTQPTTTTRLTTQPTTTTRIATQPATAATQPSTTTKYDITDYTSTTLGPAAPLTNYIQTYEVDWDIFSSLAPTFIQEDNTPDSPMTTDHPLVEKMKNEMAKKKVGYFSVCLKMFFELFSTKENSALKDLLKGGSNALEKMNENHDLEGLGPPMWPGTELGFLQMRMTPIEKVKNRGKIAYTFYSSGLVFNVKSLHRRIDNLYYNKEGEDMMQALAEFKDYPGVNVDMDPSQIMEHLFRSLLAPYLRDKTSPKVLSIVKEINEMLAKIRKTFFGGGGGRRNTPGEYKYTSTIKYKLKNKVANIENSNKGTMDDNDYEESDDISEIPIYNSGGDDSYNAVKHKDEIDEAKTIYDSYEVITTKKMESVVVIGNSNKKSMKTKEFVNDTYVRMSKVTDKRPRILYDSGTEKDTKKLNCNNDECTTSDTNAVPKTKKYGQNKLRYKKAESKDKLLKDVSEETSGLIGHHKETEMGYSIKHEVTEDATVYHHDKYNSKIPKKFPKSYQNAKKAFKSSKSDHDNGFLKDNKENNTYHTNRARNGESSDEKMYLEIIKYKKSEPKRYHETDNKIDYINSKHQINLKTKYVKGNQKLNCYDNNDECTAADTNAVSKRVSRIKYSQNKEGYRNAESKVRPLTDTQDRIHGQIRHHKEPEISYSVTQKVTEATNFYHHVKYGQKESKKYHTTYKKATKSSKKDNYNRVSKDTNTNIIYYVKNGKPSDKKWNLEVLKYNQLEPATNEEKDNKIDNIHSKEKINGNTKYVRGTYEEGHILQTKGVKSKIKAQSKVSDLSYKSTKKTYFYETNHDETESKIRNKKENKVGINWKGGLSKNKDEDYDTFDDSVESKEIEHGKTTNSHIKDVRANKNKNTSASRNSIKAKQYIKELRIRRTTKEKEYFRDTKKYYTTTISSNGEKFQHKKIDKKYLGTENYKIWSSSEKVNPTKTYVTENEVPRYANKKVLEDQNAPRSKKNKTNIFQENFNSFENELKNKHQENKLESYDNQLNAQKSKTNVKNTKNPINRNTNLSERVQQKRFKHKQNPEAKNNEKHNSLSQSPKPLGVDSEVPDLKQKQQDLKNKKDKLLKHHNNNNSSYNKNSKKHWPHSKSQYIVKDDPYLKERFLDFNRDKTQNKTRYSLRNLHKSKNILRVESSYSDEEEVLKSNLQDNLLHGGRNFTDTLHKHNKSNKIRDISSYSDEEDTLKKNIYKLFT